MTCYNKRCNDPVVGTVELIPAHGDKDAFVVKVCEGHGERMTKRGKTLVRNEETSDGGRDST